MTDELNTSFSCHENYMQETWPKASVVRDLEISIYSYLLLFLRAVLSGHGPAIDQCSVLWKGFGYCCVFVFNTLEIVHIPVVN